MGNQINKTKKLTLSSIIAAVSIITLLLQSYIPTGKLGFYVLVALLTAIVVIECKNTYAIIEIIVVSSVVFIISPSKFSFLPYLMFFGTYAIVKFSIETKLHNPFVQYVFKYVYFNVVGVSMYFIASLLLPEVFNELIKSFESISIPTIAIIVVLEVLFFAYDFLYTKLIDYYHNSIRGKLNS